MPKVIKGKKYPKVLTASGRKRVARGKAPTFLKRVQHLKKRGSLSGCVSGVRMQPESCPSGVRQIYNANKVGALRSRVGAGSSNLTKLGLAAALAHNMVGKGTGMGRVARARKKFPGASGRKMELSKDTLITYIKGYLNLMTKSEMERAALSVGIPKFGSMNKEQYKRYLIEQVKRLPKREVADMEYQAQFYIQKGKEERAMARRRKKAKSKKKKKKKITLREHMRRKPGLAPYYPGL